MGISAGFLYIRSLVSGTGSVSGINSRNTKLLCALAITLLLCAAGADARLLNDPFASSVISFNPGPGFFNYLGSPYLVQDKCLHAPLWGADVYNPELERPWAIVDSPCNDSVVTLGDRRVSTGKGTVTLAFSEDITDDPKNPYGLDFIVFSNAYFVGGNPAKRWQELAFVEISPDNINWYLIEPSKLPADLIGAKIVDKKLVPGDTGSSTTVLRGYAESTPTIDLPQYGSQSIFNCTRTAAELYTVPDRPSLPSAYNAIDLDYVSGGGDALDIADAILEVQSTPGVPVKVNNQTVKANISKFRYIRITDAIEGDKDPAFGEISAEIDAVSAVRPAMSIGEAKGLTENGYALITEAVVTAVFDNEFFIESPDRSAAVKVAWNSYQPINAKHTEYIQAGDKVTITGHISKSSRMLTLPDPMFSVTAVNADLPKPVAMSCKTTESDLAYGMRGKICGKVTDPGDGTYCTISDGSADVKVRCDLGLGEVTQDSFVIATGIIDREEGTGILRLVDPTDIN